MNLAKYPRRRYTSYKTPIEHLERLSKLLGGPNIYMKRDDLLGLAGGGNKTRKLEFLMAEALEQGADTIITCGTVQSNHCRLTIGAAVKEGLKAQIIMEERIEGSYDRNATGNNFIYHLLGVEDVHVVPGGSDMPNELEKLAEKLRAEGRKPYIVQGGGSNELGCLGYISCAQEINEQLFDMGLNIDKICCVSGSSSMHVGLLVGTKGLNMNIPIQGVSVGKKEPIQGDKVKELADKVTEIFGMPEISREEIVVDDNYIGESYGAPTKEMVEAIQMVAREEGIILDAVYTGKFMAAIIGMIREGKFEKGENILLLNSGSGYNIFSYEDILKEEVYTK